MKRRSFIQSSFVGAVGATILRSRDLSSKENNKDSGTMCYMAESGVYGVDNTFVIGILQVSNSELNEANISRLRDLHGYRNILRYRSNDRYKISFVKSVIDVFFTSDNYKLYLLQSDITNDIASINRKLSYANEKKMINLKRLLNSYEPKENMSEIISKYQSLNGPSSGYCQNFESETGLNLNIKVTRESNLLQLASFLISTVSAIIKGNIDHPVKSELTTYFQSKIKNTNFTNSFSGEKIVFIK